MIQILMMRWSSLNQFSFQSMSWMHYGLVLVSFIIRHSNISHNIDRFYQLFSKNVILCVNNWSKLVLPPMLSYHSLLATLFHHSCDPNMMHFYWFGQHPPRYVSNEHFDFCYLSSFSCSAYATIRSLSCINKLDDIFIFYIRRMSYLFFAPFCSFSSPC